MEYTGESVVVVVGRVFIVWETGQNGIGILRREEFANEGDQVAALNRVGGRG